MTANVTIKPSGRELTVREGESILDAALRQGVALPYGCRSGSCGTCCCRLVSGEVQYPEGPPIGLMAEEIAAGQILACRAHPVSDLVIEAQEMKGVGEFVIKTLPARVARLEKLGHDVMGVWLKLPAVERLPFLAGQYLDILLRDGNRRSFSIANAPHDDELLELHIRYVPGGNFTSRVFADLKEKALLRVQGPLGTFYIRDESDRPIILVAGGTGFAPMKAIIEHAMHVGETRSIRLYWGVRAERDLYAAELPASWKRRLPDFDFVPVLSNPNEATDPAIRTGWVHEAVLQDYPDLSGHDVYLAGPPPMIEAAKPEFLAAGLSYSRLFFDSFEFAPEVQAALDAAAEAAAKISS